MTVAINLKAERIRVGGRFSVSFQRKQRVDDSSAPAWLPSWGALPIKSLQDYWENVSNFPDIENAFVIPVGENEAVWLGFQGASFKPNALKVGIGDRDIITCEKWDDILTSNPQNYLVCPPQLSLETMCVREGERVQIVPPALGSDPADWRANRIRLIVYEPFESRFATEASNEVTAETNVLHSFELNDTERGEAVEIHPDPYGVETWDRMRSGSLQIYMANHEQYRNITGCEPPAAPSSTDVYSGHLFP